MKSLKVGEKWCVWLASGRGDEFVEESGDISALRHFSMSNVKQTHADTGRELAILTAKSADVTAYRNHAADQ